MTNPHGKTIQIFLPTGEPRGIRVAELTTRIVQAVLVPRSDLAKAKKRAELDHVAIYFLFGESDDQAKPIVYVGQTEDLRKRLDQHNNKKDFWRTAVLIISKTQSFTQAHIRYLEWYCIQRVKEVGRFALDNDQLPSEPFITEPMEAELLDAFETLSTLVATLGFPVFEPIEAQTKTEAFYCRGPDADAVGSLVEDGFVVRAQSKARREVTPSGQDWVAPLQTKLTDSGVLVPNDRHLIFENDYVFNSPSSAAAVVLGRKANGWTEWKDQNGKTLHERKRATNSE